jgi:hypothetical protein
VQARVAYRDLHDKELRQSRFLRRPDAEVGGDCAHHLRLVALDQRGKAIEPISPRCLRWIRLVGKSLPLLREQRVDLGGRG